MGNGCCKKKPINDGTLFLTSDRPRTPGTTIDKNEGYINPNTAITSVHVKPRQVQSLAEKEKSEKADKQDRNLMQNNSSSVYEEYVKVVDAIGPQQSRREGDLDSLSSRSGHSSRLLHSQLSKHVNKSYRIGELIHDEDKIKIYQCMDQMSGKLFVMKYIYVPTDLTNSWRDPTITMKTLRSATKL